jgi:hypothetical protein
MMDMNIASVRIGRVAMLPADAYILQAFIICVKASKSLPRKAFPKPSQKEISASNACL